MSVNYSIVSKGVFGLFIATFLVAMVATSAQEDVPSMSHYEYRADPTLLVASYYNAINLQDYERAFGYWETPPASTPDLASFEQGFSVTARIAPFSWVPVYVDAGAGNLFAQVPVLLVSQLVDGTEQVYSGCFTAHKTNVPEGDATEPDPNWSLRDAALVEVPTFDVSLLETACDETMVLADAHEDLSSPVTLLASYFGAIVTGDYERAFGYWETPPESTPDLASFEQGFADTKDATLILRLDVAQDGAAGSSYTSLPALLISTLDDDTVQHFAGCYVARQVNVPVGDATEPDPNWHLYKAQVEAIDAVTDGMTLLEGACAGMSS